MSSSLPIVRQVAWLSVLPQLAILLLLIAFAEIFVTADDSLLAGVSVYFVLLVVVRQLVPLHHRKGIRLFKQERFTEAIPYFKESYKFFSRHLWVDRWRAITMLSSSRISYREMALLNVAFCLAQTGEQQKAQTEYRRVLTEFPNSKMAETALRMMVSSTSDAQQGVQPDGPTSGGAAD